MLLIDTKRGALIADPDIQEPYATEKPYGAWLDSLFLPPSQLPRPTKGLPSALAEPRGQRQ